MPRRGRQAPRIAAESPSPDTLHVTRSLDLAWAARAEEDRHSLDFSDSSKITSNKLLRHRAPRCRYQLPFALALLGVVLGGALPCLRRTAVATRPCL
eukprot:254812-Heterocapsa_arctica.AAC.1